VFIEAPHNNYTNEIMTISPKAI